MSMEHQPEQPPDSPPVEETTLPVEVRKPSRNIVESIDEIESFDDVLDLAKDGLDRLKEGQHRHHLRAPCPC